VLVVSLGLAAIALPASARGADSVVVQPDGKIVVATRAWPGAATLVRLRPDGRPDRSFGDDGSMVDRRAKAFKALALQPDGKIVVGMDGWQLGRYLPDGSPDPGFAAGGFTPFDPTLGNNPLFGVSTPRALVVMADGRIAVGGATAGANSAPAAIVHIFSAGGAFMETAGRVPVFVGPEPRRTEAELTDLTQTADGSLVMAGTTAAIGRPQTFLLARFVPGSGTAYDTSFGGGNGLVEPELYPGAGGFMAGDPFETATSIVRSGGRLIVAGQISSPHLAVAIARFGEDGVLDAGFGQGGFATSAVDLPGGPHYYLTVGSVAVDEMGRLLVAGMIRREECLIVEGSGRTRKVCEERDEPLVGRFNPDGTPDPTFGRGGFLKVEHPGGEELFGGAEEVSALPGGAVLVAGFADAPGSLAPNVPFVARLDSSGAFDPGFGDGGLTEVVLPCAGPGVEELRGKICLTTPEVSVRVRGLAAGRPHLRLKIESSIPLAQIGDARLRLPPQLASSGGSRTIRLRVPRQASALTTTLGPRALRTTGDAGRRKLSFGVTVGFRFQGQFAGRRSVRVMAGGRSLGTGPGA
jgi:uncharacterized delta-60 repeat protein